MKGLGDLHYEVLGVGIFARIKVGMMATVELEPYHTYTWLLCFAKLCSGLQVLENEVNSSLQVCISNSWVRHGCPAVVFAWMMLEMDDAGQESKEVLQNDPK